MALGHGKAIGASFSHGPGRTSMAGSRTFKGGPARTSMRGPNPATATRIQAGAGRGIPRGEPLMFIPVLNQGRPY